MNCKTLHTIVYIIVNIARYSMHIETNLDLQSYPQLPF